MSNKTRFLYPTDFSEVSQAALPAAIQLSLAFGAQLHVQHVTADDSTSNEREKFPGFREYRKAAKQYAGEMFEVLLESRPSDSIDIVKISTHNEAVPTGILEHAVESEVDMIIMATHGHRGLRHQLLGSVAEEVVRRAECPVLTLPGDTGLGEEEKGRVAVGLRDGIVAAVDLTPHSIRVLEQAKSFSLWSGAAIDILHVVELGKAAAAYESLPEVSSSARDQVEAEVVERLTSLAEQAELHPTQFTCHVLEGKPSDRILEWIEEHQSELLVQGNHGREGEELALLGSVSERLVNRARCPVLTVKQRDDSD